MLQQLKKKAKLDEANNNAEDYDDEDYDDNGFDDDHHHQGYAEEDYHDEDEDNYDEHGKYIGIGDANYDETGKYIRNQYDYMRMKDVMVPTVAGIRTTFTNFSSVTATRIFNQTLNTNGGTLFKDGYWSSTEIDINFPFILNFNDGDYIFYPKTTPNFFARGVKAF